LQTAANEGTHSFSLVFINKQAAKVIVWPRKNGNESNNQLWMYDQGFIINKNSGLGKSTTGTLVGGNQRFGSKGMGLPFFS
jgi:hypothetical protein